LPFLADNGRIVNVSSMMAALNYHKKPVQDEFNDPKIELQQIYTAIEEYVALCESGDTGKWWCSAYGTSKLLLNAWSRFILKRQLKPNQVSIAMSPGWCKTDMGGVNAPNSS
jgi:carbonyl reductase 1